MATLNEQILRVTKEIVVKFIETGRVSPATFAENFENIYSSVDSTVKNRIGAEPTQTKDDESSKKWCQLLAKTVITGFPIRWTDRNPGIAR